MTKKVSQKLMNERADDSLCPLCTSENTAWGSIDVEGSHTVQEGSCNDCGAAFHTVYVYRNVVIDSKGDQ